MYFNYLGLKCFDKLVNRVIKGWSSSCQNINHPGLAEMFAPDGVPGSDTIDYIK